jgi:lipoate-protein ligase B
MRKCTIFTLDEVSYDEALSFQFELVERVKEKKGKESYLVLLEHLPVMTIGKNGNQNNIFIDEDLLKAKGICLRRIDRGGDVTYHGPGQLVGYPIMSLPYYKKTVKGYVDSLEEAMIQTLSAFGIKAERRPKYIGIWVADEKIGFIGVRVSHGITYHGFSLNVHPDLTPFTYMKPCGIANCRITSMEKILNSLPAVPDVMGEFIKQYNKIFDITSIVVKTKLSHIPKNLFRPQFELQAN